MIPIDFPGSQYPFDFGAQHPHPHPRQIEQQQQQQEHLSNSMTYATYPVRSHDVNTYYMGPHHSEYPDMGPITPDHEDFEGCGGAEILTRPRLTKDQVEVLETQFQAHPKPNGNVKRQLALQTKLNLPRVANWFQNRRAKAKQMRKQEEFGLAQSADIGEAWNNERQIPSGFTIPLQINTVAATTSSQQALDSSAVTGPTSASSSAQASSTHDTPHDASWASLQRALNVANNARPQFQARESDSSFTSLPYREPSRPSNVAGQDHAPLGPSPYSDWSSNTSSSGLWTISAQPSEGAEFDFDFGTHPLSQQTSEEDAAHSGADSPGQSQGFASSGDVWTSAVPTPTGNFQGPASATPLLKAESLQVPEYSGNRRGSASEELSASLDQFEIAGTPPLAVPLMTESLQFRKPDSHIGIAARRKVPRPAAIGTAALRSNSYGGHSAMSPTFRLGRPQQSPHSIRHVKSTGQNLNVNYAGIRKMSAPQKSPLNIATFAEAEEFSNLIATRNLSRHVSEQHSISPQTPLTNEDAPPNQMPMVAEPFFMDQEQAIANHHTFGGHQAGFRLASPPSTPLKPEFFGPSHMSAMMPPLSAPPQYAFFPDYTPPYSAGPLTASSWSDAPITSPEMATFPSATQISQPHPYSSTPVHEYPQGIMYFGQPGSQPQSQSQSQSHSPIDQKQLELTPPAHKGQKQTEFFIQEFPRQKEAHAHAAQQMSHQRPKNYVFSNATQSDF